MLTDARQNMIKKIAERDGEVIISRVAQELNVSIETVRRDINALCKKNVLQKVHGGAVPASLVVLEDAYTLRKEKNSEIKRKISVCAAELVKDNTVVALSSGTTAEAVAEALKGKKGITVITNSLSVAAVFSASDEINVILTGGNTDLAEHLTFGTVAKEQLKKYSADTVFIGCAAIDEKGFMCSSLSEGEMISALLKIGQKKVLVADSSKLNKTSVYRFALQDEIDVLVTDRTDIMKESLKDTFKKNGIKIITAK